jgi:hypothetical protein
MLPLMVAVGLPLSMRSTPLVSAPAVTLADFGSTLMPAP